MLWKKSVCCWFLFDLLGGVSKLEQRLTWRGCLDCCAALPLVSSSAKLMLAVSHLNHAMPLVHSHLQQSPNFPNESLGQRLLTCTSHRATSCHISNRGWAPCQTLPQQWIQGFWCCGGLKEGSCWKGSNRSCCQPRTVLLAWLDNWFQICWAWLSSWVWHSLGIETWEWWDGAVVQRHWLEWQQQECQPHMFHRWDWTPCCTWHLNDF